MSIWLNVEISAGSDIVDTSKEAVELAKRLNIEVWFDFNGVHTLARPTDNPEEIVKAFHRAFNSDSTYKIACAE